VRPVVQAILDELLERHRALGHVHLNDISEVIGPRAVSYEEVECLITRLEEAGLRVGELLDESDIGVMRGVIERARDLRASLGRAPTVDEIAASVGRPAHVVRRALEHAKQAALDKKL